MQSVICKHSFLPIPDLAIDYEVFDDERLVRIHLGDHFDSTLLIDFCRRMLDVDGVQVVDEKSAKQFGRAHMPEKYAVEVVFLGETLQAEIVEMMTLGSDVKRFTVSLERKDRRPDLQRITIIM